MKYCIHNYNYLFILLQNNNNCESLAFQIHLILKQQLHIVDPFV